jgi:sugar phosphate permease
MAVLSVSPRMRRMQWTAIILVTAAIALNYMDRSTLAIGNVKIRQEFGLSAAEIGLLQSLWSLTYAIFQLPIGFMLDRLGPRYLVGIALALWSLAQAAGGFAGSYAQLLWARVTLGAAECPAFPGAVRITSDWFHVKDRGTPTGVYNSGGSIGPAIAPPILTGIMLAFDWRVMFIVMGLAGVVGALVWFMVYRDPAKTALAPQDEAYLAENRAGQAPVELRQATRLFRQRAIWGMTMGAFCSGYSIWMYQTWLPYYLESQQHISIGKTGVLASIPLILSVVGAWAGGIFSDRLAKRGAEIVASRRIPTIMGLVSGVFTTLAVLATGPTPALACISASMFFLSFGVAGKWTMITAVAPQSYCTTVAGIQNFGGYIGGAVSPWVTGFVVDMTGSFVIALVIGAVVTTCGALIMHLMVRNPIPTAALEDHASGLRPVPGT